VRTQVAIVGAGPAGLMLSHLLHLEGIRCVVLEARTREYVERRLRAGVLEQGSVDLLCDTGVGERLLAEGLRHEGIELRFDGEAHRVALTELTGRAITVYGQQEVVKDLIAARLAADGEILFGVEDVRLGGLDSATPSVRFRLDGAEQVLGCDFVAGCDGSHGVSRGHAPASAVTTYERTYGFNWLGILAEVAPPSHELIYCHHPRGFALSSQRSPTISRLYLQVEPDEHIEQWPDDRIWSELQTRLAMDGFSLTSGPVIEKGITAMRSFVCEPMQYGRLFLAGDAVHVVPPTGAKGMNLALADARVLGRAMASYYAGDDETALAAYSSSCLRRVWRAQHFSFWMTSMLHPVAGDDYGFKLQLGQLRNVAASPAYARALAENYVGPVDV
jgi:p-hydroxybenzoate 3-monooxygenase